MGYDVGMNGVENINSLLEGLPPAYRAEALDFIEFLSKKARHDRDDLSDADWSAFSIENALRDVEDEADIYSEADIKERWR